MPPSHSSKPSVTTSLLATLSSVRLPLATPIAVPLNAAGISVLLVEARCKSHLRMQHIALRLVR
ncbi:hypothetical protein Godav_022999 [Gossypium davidsonii]|uniref:Uncharacterized protein n=1 Tax=Gossypium davidsonii TaxID=34287 RepID=A0A7J8SQY5_GOSDV|nr:hypothetical protein [Gossypium davidsonii]